MWIASTTHIREIDRRATEDYGLSPSVLVERAGYEVFRVVRELLPEGGRIAVLCGRGKNGADGLVVARAARDAGLGVECLVAGTRDQLVPEGRLQLVAAEANGVDIVFADDARFARRLEGLGQHDLLVDALLGIGAKNNVHGVIKETIQAVNRSGVPVVSVDIPSGIDADTGEELGESVWALRTVTFALPKPYLFEGIGLEHAGHWSVTDIGMPAALLNEPTEAKVLDGDWVGCLLPERARAAHKGESGSLLIVAGSDRMRGAAILTAKAALRSGAGLVTVASVASVCAAISAAVPEALVLPLPEYDGHIAADAADALQNMERYHATVFGPGLGRSEGVTQFLERVWADWTLPSVIDADALNAVAAGVRLPSAECVLTPHPGEMSRLLQLSVAELQSDRFATMHAATERFGCSVLLKGPYTLIGEPGQPILVNSTGNSGLAMGGSGDVLSGMIGTMLAQDLPGYYAAACAAFWHGLSADQCSDEIGPVGYLPTDVADHLPRARSRIIKLCNGSCC